MPQPLSRVKPKASVQFGLGAIQAYPHLAAIAMETIAAISFAEYARGKLLAQLLGAELRVGIAMYEALTSTVAQSAALLAAVKESLSEEDQALFSKIKSETSFAFNRRHHFAHHVWGVSEDIPDALLLMDSKHLIDKSTPDDLPPQMKHKFSLIAFDKKKIFVYKEKNLIASRDAAHGASKMYHVFWMYIMSKQDHQAMMQGTMPEDLRNSLQEMHDSMLARLRSELPTA